MIEIAEVVRHTNGEPDLYCPVLVCDVCRTMITEHGNIEWRQSPKDRTLRTPPFASHKDPCSRRLQAFLDQAYPGWYMSWAEASEIIMQLRNNFKSPISELDAVTSVNPEKWQAVI